MMIVNLDLVVTVDTAMAHLAGEEYIKSDEEPEPETEREQLPSPGNPEPPLPAPSQIP